MFDTHAIARRLAGAGFTVEQADAITDAVRQAAARGDHVTSETFAAGLAELRIGLASLEARLIKWMIGTVFVAAGLVAAALRVAG